MPFNVWCEGCGHLIGKGVRFNAEKQEIGMYHSTKIWSFTMTAPCCQQRIEVQTDPKNAQYNVVSGGKQKVSQHMSCCTCCLCAACFLHQQPPLMPFHMQLAKLRWLAQTCHSLQEQHYHVGPVIPPWCCKQHLETVQLSMQEPLILFLRSATLIVWSLLDFIVYYRLKSTQQQMLK